MGKQSGSSENAEQRLIRLYDSADIHVSNEAAAALREQISTGPSYTLISVLVEHYFVDRSPRTLDLLVSVREPYDKVLLDKLDEVLKSNAAQVAGLLTEFAQRQVSWLPRLVNHTFMVHLLRCLKSSSTDVISLTSCLLLLSALLPQMPILNSNSSVIQLTDLFAVLVKGADVLLTKIDAQRRGVNTGSETTTDTGNHLVQLQLNCLNVGYLQTALDAYFQRIYGIYPCNSVSFLRSHFNSNRERRKLFDNVFRPMLARCRFHPLLVSGSSNSETSKERWLLKEPHDIIAECIAITVDGANDGDGGTEVDANAISAFNPSIVVDQPLVSGSTSSRNELRVQNAEGGNRSTSFTSFNNGASWSAFNSCITTPIKPERPGSNTFGNESLPMFRSISGDRMSSFVPISLPPDAVDNESSKWPKKDNRKSIIDTASSPPPLISKGGMANELQQHGVQSSFWSPSMAVGLETPPESRRSTPLPTGSNLSRRESGSSSVRSSQRLQQQLHPLHHYQMQNSSLSTLLSIGGSSVLQQTTGEDSSYAQSSFQGLTGLFRRRNFSARQRRAETADAAMVNRRSVHSIAEVAPVSADQYADNLMATEEKAKGDVLRSSTLSSAIKHEAVESDPVETSVTVLHNRQASLASQAEEATEALEAEELGQLSPPPRFPQMGDDNDSQVPIAVDTSTSANQQLTGGESEFVSSSDREVASILNEHQMQIGSRVLRLPIGDSSVTSSVTDNNLLQTQAHQQQMQFLSGENVNDFMLRRNRIKFTSECSAENADQCPPLVSMDNRILNSLLSPSAIRKRSFSCGARPSKVTNTVVACDDEVPQIVVDEPRSAIVGNGNTWPPPSIRDRAVSGTRIGLPEKTLNDFALLNSLLGTQLSRVTAEHSVYSKQHPKNSAELDSDITAAQTIATKELLELRRSCAAGASTMSDYSSDTAVANPLGANFSTEQQVAILKAQLQLCQQQLLYEKYRRALHALRNRRLFARLKQQKAVEMENDNLQQCICTQEKEIQNFIAATSELRRQMNLLKDEYGSKEFRLTMILEEKEKVLGALRKSIEHIRHQLTESSTDKETMTKELGLTKQRMMNCEAELEFEKKQYEAVQKQNAEAAITKERLRQSELRLGRLEQLESHCTRLTASLRCAEQHNRLTELSQRKEWESLRRQVKRERQKADTAVQKAAHIEGQLQRYIGDIAELHALLDAASKTHQEHLDAVEWKYKALMNVSQRQEGHIAEMYAELTTLASTHRPLFQATTLTGSVTARPVSIPTRDGAQEVASYGSSFGETAMAAAFGSQHSYKDVE